MFPEREWYGFAVAKLEGNTYKLLDIIPVGVGTKTSFSESNYAAKITDWVHLLASKHIFIHLHSHNSMLVNPSSTDYDNIRKDATSSHEMGGVSRSIIVNNRGDLHYIEAYSTETIVKKVTTSRFSNSKFTDTYSEIDVEFFETRYPPQKESYDDKFLNSLKNLVKDELPLSKGQLWSDIYDRL